MSSLSPEAYAVIEGRHSDPFRYLKVGARVVNRIGVKTLLNERISILF